MIYLKIWFHYRRLIHVPQKAEIISILHTMILLLVIQLAKLRTISSIKGINTVHIMN